MNLFRLFKKEPLTKKQYQLLEFIKVFKKVKGYMPTIKEINKQFNLSAYSTTFEKLEELKDKGYIKRRKHKARHIEIQ